MKTDFRELRQQEKQVGNCDILCESDSPALQVKNLPYVPVEDRSLHPL